MKTGGPKALLECLGFYLRVNARNQITGKGWVTASAQAEKRQDHADDDNKTDDINDGVHDFLLG